MLTPKEVIKKLISKKAQLKQVSDYYIPPDKKSTSAEPGISNVVLVNWKQKRIIEITEEIFKLKLLQEET